MIEIKNVSKEFTKKNEKGKSVKFLADKDISFEVHDGEILGLLGPNGAGKTTLLRMIAGIMKPTTGQIQIDNTTYDKDEIAIKKNISFLSGNTKLYKDISCVELLKMCAGYYGMDKSIVSNRIDEVIARFDMDSFKNQRIGNLSTGQVQRLGVSRCVLHDPHYYVLDEATSGLDIISSQIILDFIKEERDKGKCIIYSTHYMEEAEALSDRIGIMKDGRLCFVGAKEELFETTGAQNVEDAFIRVVGGGERDA